MDKDAILFQALAAMFHAAAMQAMGKTANPVSGKVERDLEQAQSYIDLLEVIRNKTKGNLSEPEQNLLDQIITECQLNYVDEKNKDQAPQPAPQQ